MAALFPPSLHSFLESVFWLRFGLAWAGDTVLILAWAQTKGRGRRVGESGVASEGSGLVTRWRSSVWFWIAEQPLRRAWVDLIAEADLRFRLFGVVFASLIFPLCFSAFRVSPPFPGWPRSSSTVSWGFVASVAHLSVLKRGAGSLGREGRGREIFTGQNYVYLLFYPLKR
jgi:hypothetical protein